MGTADLERAHHHVVDVRSAGRDESRQKPFGRFNRATGTRCLRPRVLPDRIAAVPLRRRSPFVMKHRTLNDSVESAALSGTKGQSVSSACSRSLLPLAVTLVLLVSIGLPGC